MTLDILIYSLYRNERENETDSFNEETPTPPPPKEPRQSIDNIV